MSEFHAGDGNYIHTKIHPASEEPVSGNPVLAQGLKGQWFVVSTKLVWANTVQFYDVQKWCYLPEGKV
jgi:hypothetical protein